MNSRIYQRILYFIIATIGLTLLVQLYWNYKNYEKNLVVFQNEVQISLDNALEVYYAEMTKNNHMTFIDLEATDNKPDNILDMIDKMETDSIFQSIQDQHGKSYDSITQIVKTDSGEQAFTFSKVGNKVSNLKVVRGKKAADSIRLLKNITSIYISIQDDSIKLSKLSPIIEKELSRKQLSIPFALQYQNNDSTIASLNKDIVSPDYFKTETKSKFLKDEESLAMFYPNATNIVLRQGISGIAISSILVLGIVACLIYLLKIIKDQRQLSELKNDLISNITHEFKTPISTIGVAIESIRDFDGLEDKQRTNTYLNMSSEQLTKLNTMVEKLLETATLDRDQLELNKEPINLIDLLKSAVDDLRIRASDETINFEYHQEIIKAVVDPFHFDNAINNIMDNALKYGGNRIDIQVRQTSKIEIEISDNGHTLSKESKDKIFEKFYRVPKGNTHDVKGFGIGLYYSKKIIENHQGSIELQLKPQRTTFKITLPNE